jgi:hypothetical protein
VVGRGASEGQVELVCRDDGQRRDLAVEAALDALLEVIPAGRSGLESGVEA